MSPPRIAVVTPYYKEPEQVLWQCHQSVLNQGVEATHFMVADGFPNSRVAQWNVQHVVLPSAHGDNGNTPRGVGAMLAASEGFDFIAYLDADNWYEDFHLSSLLELHASGGYDVCCSFRNYYTLEGELLTSVTEPDEDNFTHVDTSCFLVHRNGFGSNTIWFSMPIELSPICDRVFFKGLRFARYRVGFSLLRTVAFRSQYEFHYLSAGINPPSDVKRDVGFNAREWMTTVDGASVCVRTLGFLPL